MLNDNGHIGLHVIADLYDVPQEYLANLRLIEELIHKAAQEAGARPIAGNFHHFGENFGVTGVLLLKESHISIHTWPEYGFAAIDIFMCGDAKPEKAVDVIKNIIKPKHANIRNLSRGNLFPSIAG